MSNICPIGGVHEQQYMERAFRTLFMLQSVRWYTLDEIATSTGTCKRTIQRYINNFRNSGFDIMFDKGCPRLNVESRQNKTILNCVSGTNEWRTLKNIDEFEAAIKLGNCVRLVGYASGHSKSIKDRDVEPFKTTADKRFVWCYDPSDGKCKIFRPSRCQDVKTLERKCTHQNQYKIENIDLFGFPGKESIKVVVTLDIVARNLLLEENGESALNLREVEANNKWLLDTDVYNIQGIGRFCMGLIGHFEIVDAPELVKYMKGKCEELNCM